MNRFTPLQVRPPVTLFHDGHCPICRQEIAWLAKHRRIGYIVLVDIQDEHFNAQTHGCEFTAMMGQLHLRDGQGKWYIEMDANRALYAVLGYRRLVWISCLPGIRGLMNAGYRFFARRRIRIGQWWEKRQSKA
ncbi:MAG: thiol-disulfide oxidoreductase DCC family protein [Halomonas sp.]|uniref:thiol-disulfide oxidoreductase DCC family protein n=1 Tax=Halomonas sp. TaxID=1486246 RepID=UPI003F92B8FE